MSHPRCVAYKYKDRQSEPNTIWGYIILFTMEHNLKIYYFASIIIQNNAIVYSLFISANRSTCFGCIPTHHQELISLYLRYLALLGPLLPPVVSITFTTVGSNGLINARYCRYSDMSSWWCMEIPPETCRGVCRYK